MASIEEPQWITITTVSALCMCLHVYLLKMEIRNRRNAEETFDVTSYMKAFTLCTIISGASASFFSFIGYFQFMCNTSLQFALICFGLQFVSINCYQLSQLHYSFAKVELISNYNIIHMRQHYNQME